VNRLCRAGRHGIESLLQIQARFQLTRGAASRCLRPADLDEDAARVKSKAGHGFAHAVTCPNFLRTVPR